MATPLNKDEIADLVASRIDGALRRNTPMEAIIIVILVVVAGVGLFLLITGASAQRWELLASGSACEVALGWPVKRLLDLRRFNLVYQTLPDLMRMADTLTRKKQMAEFIAKLMKML